MNYIKLQILDIYYQYVFLNLPNTHTAKLNDLNIYALLLFDPSFILIVYSLLANKLVELSILDLRLRKIYYLIYFYSITHYYYILKPL